MQDWQALQDLAQVQPFLEAHVVVSALGLESRQLYTVLPERPLAHMSGKLCIVEAGVAMCLLWPADFHKVARRNT